MTDSSLAAQTGRKRGRPRNTGNGGSAGTVQALEKGLVLLRALAESEGATLTDLSLATGMAVSTAHRLLSTMERHGMVEFDGATQEWMMGVETFRIGSAFLRRANIVSAGRAVLRQLMEDTGETANIAIADDGDVVFVSQVETHNHIRAFFRPGTRGNMHASGIGKALLAQLSRKELEKILRRKGLPRFTDKTLTSPDALFTDLEAIRRRGWSIDDEERNQGMRCVAAPIFNEYGEAIAGISISGPTARLSDEKLGEYGPLVRRAAQAITDRIGGGAPVLAEGA